MCFMMLLLEKVIEALANTWPRWKIKAPRDSKFKIEEMKNP